MMLDHYGYYPVGQTYKADDEDRHMVISLSGNNLYGVLKFRCGRERPHHYGAYRHCSWSTSDMPTCPECLEWFTETYLRQEVLEFPNGYDSDGFWTYLPEEGKPIPKWWPPPRWAI